MSKFSNILSIPNLSLLFPSFSCHQVIRNFVIFHQIKVTKHTATHAATLVLISPTFYEQLFRPNPFAEKLQTQIVSTLKLRKKFHMKMLLIKYW
jgi:hypothetical protein